MCCIIWYFFHKFNCSFSALGFHDISYQRCTEMKARRFALGFRLDLGALEGVCRTPLGMETVVSGCFCLFLSR